MCKFVLLLAMIVMPMLAKAGVVTVEFKEKGFLFSDAPTFNFEWSSHQAKATLIFIPGGEGRLGINPERKNLGGFYGSTLRPLSDANLSSGLFNVVVFDSPVILPVGNDYPSSRQASEHLLRIESVVRHFKALYGLPVWIMGHSNGAVSITEFYKMLQKKKQESLVAGAIYSSARNGARFDENTQLPILFMAHERDGCVKSMPSRSKAVFEQQQKSNPMKIRYVFITGGEAQADNPCSSGFHMFFGANKEAFTAIEQFVFETGN